jgi:hypothetical protein
LQEALRRGVRCRGVIEEAAVDDPAVGPYLKNWINQGEEDRVYRGKLPHKLALFDRQSAFVGVAWPGGETRNIYIRHAELAESLGIVFDTFWEHSEPLIQHKKENTAAAVALPIRNGRGNGQTTRTKT